MQSSCSVIKNNSVDLSKKKSIKTSYENKLNVESEPSIEKAKESLQTIKESILGNVNMQKEAIIKSAYEKAIKIEKETYEKAYKEGFRNGKEDGYKDAYENNIEIANAIVNNAKELLRNAKVEYQKYLDSKRDEIIDLAYAITEHLLEKELTKEEGVNDFIKRVLKDSNDSRTCIIKCNDSQIESVRESINESNDMMRVEILFLADKNVEKGNVVLEFENGSIEVGLSNAISSIKEEIFR